MEDVGTQIPEPEIETGQPELERSPIQVVTIHTHEQELLATTLPVLPDWPSQNLSLPPVVSLSLALVVALLPLPFVFFPQYRFIRRGLSVYIHCADHAAP